jgi:hypothetical protein
VKNRAAVHNRHINDDRRHYTVCTADGEPLACVVGIHAVYEYAEDLGLETYRYILEG